MTDRNVEELLFHMPVVFHRARNIWVRNFASSVLKQSRRKTWRASPKQVAMMRQLVSELFIEAGDVDGVEDITLRDEVIDDG
ncbi:MAG: hypothetical protein AAGA28_01565 [Pseudomonadota bacterium]